MKRAIGVAVVILMAALVVVSVLSYELYSNRSVASHVTVTFECDGGAGEPPSYACSIFMGVTFHGYIAFSASETELSVRLYSSNPYYYGIDYDANFSITSVHITGAVGNNPEIVSYGEDSIPFVSVPHDGQVGIGIHFAASDDFVRDGFMVQLLIGTELNVPLFGGLLHLPTYVSQERSVLIPAPI